MSRKGGRITSIKQQHAKVHALKLLPLFTEIKFSIVLNFNANERDYVNYIETLKLILTFRKWYSTAENCFACSVFVFKL